MKKNRSTKRALLMSALSMVLCLSMLVGSTFAWFTDSVTSSGNKIQAGTLDVDLYLYKDGGYSEITNESAPIFGTAGLAQDSLNTLWEPGKTQVAYLKIKNDGSLALKYKVNVIVKNPTGGKDLYKVMQYAIIPDAQYDSVAAWNSADAKNVVLGLNETQAAAVSMDPGAEHFFALAIHMDENAGNEYQGGAVEFDIIVSATQMTAESDSFGTDYDLLAQGGSVSDAAPASGNKEFTVYAPNSNVKVATMNIPAAAVKDPSQPMSITITPTEQDANVTVADNQKAASFDITVTNIKADNTNPIMVELNVGKGLSGVKVYHKGVEITDAGYNAITGYAVFYTTSFSPYTVVYDAVYTPGTDESEFVAVLKTYTQDEIAAVNEDLTWERYGGYTPASESQKLDAVYSFAAPHTKETIADCAYKDWICDFYVKIENVPNDAKVLPEGSITLGGNYGTWGWVGFDNPEVEVGVEYPLLQSVGGAWTYQMIVENVGTFLCGVAKADGNENNLTDAKFTVILRLTNPDNEAEIMDTNTVVYTFN